MKMNFLTIGEYRDYEGDSFYCSIRFEDKKNKTSKKEIVSFIEKSELEGLALIEWQKGSQLYLDFSDMMLWEVFGSWKKFCDILESLLKSLDEKHKIFAVIYLDDESAELDNKDLIEK